MWQAVMLQSLAGQVQLSNSQKYYAALQDLLVFHLYILRKFTFLCQTGTKSAANFTNNQNFITKKPKRVFCISFKCKMARAHTRSQ